MTTHYDTTSEQVRAAMAETGIDDYDLITALLERDNTVEEIMAMSPLRRLDEWLSWNGYGCTAGNLVRKMTAAGLAIGGDLSA